MTMRFLFTTAAALGFSLAGAAFAQSVTPAAPPPMTKIRGAVDALDGAMLKVTANSGEKFTVSLPADVRVIELTPGKLDQIKPGSYIGTAARTQPDGTLQAIEVQVFPETMRGAGEGSHPYDLGEGSSMTNGTVGKFVGSADRVMTVTFAGGERVVTVPQQAPVVVFGAGTTAMLIPGAHVIVNAAKAAGGALTAKFILVGKDGLVPPL